MKKIYGLIAIILITNFSAFCQNTKCECEDVLNNRNPDKSFFPLKDATKEKIDKWVNKIFLPIYNEALRARGLPQFIRLEVNVFSVNCVSGYGALAKKCEKEKINGNPLMILYDEQFINKIDLKNELNTLFVLAHELGHIVSDHYHSTLPYDESYDNYLKKLNKSYYREEQDNRDKKKMTISEKHLEELTADGFAIWFLRKFYEKNQSNKAIARQFDPKNLLQIFPSIEELEPAKCKESDSHPGCKRRQYFISKLMASGNWEQVMNFKKNIRSFASEYIDSTYTILSKKEIEQMGQIAKRAREKITGDSLKRIGEHFLNKEQYLKADSYFKQSIAIYSNLVYPEDSADVAQKLEELKQILSVRSFSRLSLLGGLDFIKPHLVSGNEPVNATNAGIGFAGLRLGRYSYTRKLGYEIDFKYALQTLQFDTYKDEASAIERFNSSSIYIQPRIAFKLISDVRDNNTRGLILSVGPSLMYPLNFKYQNFSVGGGNTLGVTMKPSAGINFGLGYEYLHRKLTGSTWNHWRVSLNGGYQPLKFESEQLVNQNYSAGFWLLGLDFTLGILPKFLIKKE